MNKPYYYITTVDNLVNVLLTQEPMVAVQFLKVLNRPRAIIRKLEATEVHKIATYHYRLYETYITNQNAFTSGKPANLIPLPKNLFDSSGNFERLIDYKGQNFNENYLILNASFTNEHFYHNDYTLMDFLENCCPLHSAIEVLLSNDDGYYFWTLMSTTHSLSHPDTCIVPKAPTPGMYQKTDIFPCNMAKSAMLIDILSDEEEEGNKNAKNKN